MLASQCKKCPQNQKYKCQNQFINARKGEPIYCPDGSKLYVTGEW